MNYKLAKELKDAGFPQKEDNSYWKGFTPSGNKVPYYSPTLSELIEACGEDFHCLVHQTHGGIDSDREFWSAGKSNVVTDWQNGKTPEEAVARLWLALNSTRHTQ